MMSLTAFKAGVSAGGVVEYAEKGILNDQNKGREDYYLEDGTAPAVMLGGGWEALGKSDSNYDRKAFSNALEGKNLAGETLVSGRGDGSKRVPGFDLTFSSDKSISIAWAAADEVQRRAIEAAHDRAVKAAVEHIEQRFNLANEGKGGNEQVSAKIAAAAFRHGTSRAQDPDLHTHVVVSNLAVKADGKIVSLNAREIYHRQHEAGAIYRAELARELQQQGFEIARHGRGNQFIRIAGVPKEIEDYYSKRRAEIESKMTSGQTHGGAARAAEAAALSTREGKKEIDATQLREAWRAEMAERGFTSEKLKELKKHKEVPHKLEAVDEAAILSKLTEHNSTFGKNDVWREMAIAGQGVWNAQEIAERAELLMKSQELVKLIHAETGNIRYSTRDMRDIEQRLVDQAGELRTSVAHRVDETALQKSIEQFEARKGWSLSSDQRGSLSAMTTGGDLALIQGAAGTGKSVSMEVAADAWRAAGYRVRGLAPSGKAAAELAGAGIETDTIAGALMRNRVSIDAKGREWPPKDPITSADVLVIDEAGMAGSRDTGELIRSAREAGAKIVFVGDTKQLQAVAAGGAFAALQKRYGVDAELTDVRRQQNEWGRAAVTAARHGEMADALEHFNERGLLHIVESRDEAMAVTLAAWEKHYQHARPASSVMLGNTNAEVHQLNQLAREKLKNAGFIGGLGAETNTENRAGASLGKREFLEGERVVFLRNAKIGADKMPIKNGQTGTIERIALAKDGKAYEITVKQDSGQAVKFRTDEYKAIDYSYALTTHKAQGITADHVSIMASGNMQNLHSTYVQMTRMKLAADIVLPKDDIDRALVDLPPTEKMIEYAEGIARRNGRQLPENCRADFLTCRDWLNEHSPMRIDGKMDNDKFSEIREAIKAMSKEHIKETTLDYIEAGPTPAPDKRSATPMLDNKFKKADDGVYIDKTTSQPAIVETGERVTMLNRVRHTIAAGVELARKKWGDAICITGSREFQSMAKEEAVARGIDVQILEKEKQEKEASFAWPVQESKKIESEIKEVKLTRTSEKQNIKSRERDGGMER